MLRHWIGNPGLGVQLHTSPFQPGCILEFVEQWTEQDSNELRGLLDDPWAFKDFLMTMRFGSELLKNNQETPHIQREAILHLVFPDTFEGIVSADHKRAIAKAFSGLVTDKTKDVDRKLEQIRASQERKLGRDFNFYEADIRRKWRDIDEVNSRYWDEYVARAKVYVNTGTLEAEEIKYKVDIGEMLAFVRKEVLENSKNWGSLLKNALTDKSVNFVRWSLTDNFIKWCLESPDEAMIALQRLWADDDTSVTDRIKEFSRMFPKGVISGRGTRLTMEAALLMGLDVYKFPPYMETPFSTAYELTEYGQPDKDVDEATLYEYALGFLDRLIKEANRRDLHLRHRLDAQSVVWALWKGRDGLIGDSPGTYVVGGQSTLRELANETYLPLDFLEEVVTLLEEKKQVIFQGPPGTGKTFIAQKLARCLTGSEERVTLVQFHPSYAYEDFVQGFRPKMRERAIRASRLRDGPLLEIAEKARNGSKDNCTI